MEKCSILVNSGFFFVHKCKSSDAAGVIFILNEDSTAFSSMSGFIWMAIFLNCIARFEAINNSFMTNNAHDCAREIIGNVKD